jgi:F-type H+-transporting ATPase subunit b
MDPVLQYGEAGAAAGGGMAMPAASTVVAGAAFANAYAANQMGKAAAINQQTAYLTQARDTLAIAEVKARAVTAAAAASKALIAKAHDGAADKKLADEVIASL